MTNADLQRARSHLDGLEAVLANSHGGWADEDSLLEFRRLCWAALLVVDDGECQQQIDLLVQYAKDLYSDRGHQRWDVGPVFGADILRRKIRMMLSACRVRLNGIEGGRYGKRWRDLRAA
jgi:hypothetical protein